MSPFAGAVLLAWFYWNWKVPFVLFLSDLTIEARIDEIVQNYTSLERNVWWPLVTAVAIVAVYPVLAYLPYRWWLHTDAWKQKARVAYSDSVPLTPEQVSELKRQLSQALLRISTMRDEANSAIGARESVIEELRTRLTEVTSDKAKESGLSEEFANLQGERMDALERARIANEQLERLQKESHRERERLANEIAQLKEERDEASLRREKQDDELIRDWDREFDGFLESEPDFLRSFKQLYVDINDGNRVTGQIAAAAVAHGLVQKSGQVAPNWTLTEKGRHFARRAFQPKAIPEEEIPF